MAAKRTIKVYPAGLLEKRPTLGLVTERFLARRDYRILLNLKTEAEKAISTHEIEDAEEKTIDFLQEQYYVIFHVLLNAKNAAEDFMHFVSLRGIGSPQIVGYANAFVDKLFNLAKEGQRYGNSISEASRGRTGVALTLSSKFFLNVNALQKFAGRREIKAAMKYELKSEKLEQANKYSEKVLLEIIEDKMAEIDEFAKVLKRIMTETSLFIEDLRRADRDYNLPKKDVGAILDEAAKMFENELMMFNQLANNYTRQLQHTIKEAQVRFKELPLAA